jgi:hypothetical protein
MDKVTVYTEAELAAHTELIMQEIAESGRAARIIRMGQVVAVIVPLDGVEGDRHGAVGGPGRRADRPADRRGWRRGRRAGRGGRGFGDLHPRWGAARGPSRAAAPGLVS